MDIQLQNEQLTVGIHQKGAELFSVVHRQLGLEYMWSADPAFWPKTSPILFPIVGALKNSTYYYNGKAYTLPRHGFARDHVFSISSQSETSVTFSLKHTTETKAVFPFDFALRVQYTLQADTLSVAYFVEHLGVGAMYFSLGAHPAFKVPLAPDTAYEDHYLEFSEPETTGRWPIDREGLIEATPEPLLENSNRLPLSKSLFLRDAIVLKHLRSQHLVLRATTHGHGLAFSLKGFPYLGLWAAKQADFLCIEPWCGIADSTLHNQQLSEKEGIEQVAQGETWSRMWSARFY